MPLPLSSGTKWFSLGKNEQHDLETQITSMSSDHMLICGTYLRDQTIKVPFKLANVETWVKTGMIEVADAFLIVNHPRTILDKSFAD